MSTTVYTLQGGWDASNRYTAAADVDVRINNLDGLRPVFFDVTADDTAPTQDYSKSSRVGAGDSAVLTVKNTERLWIAGSGNSVASILVLTQ